VRDLRADLRERLEVMAKEHAEMCERLRALEARQQRLQAVLRDEEGANGETLIAPHTSGHAASGARLRELVLQSLADGQERELNDLKGIAREKGLTTTGASGRTLNIILVNLHRRGLVTRLPNGKWRGQIDGRQLALDLEPPPSSDMKVRLEPERYCRCA